MSDNKDIGNLLSDIGGLLNVELEGSDKVSTTQDIAFETGIFPHLKRNLIYFGAPGTGKSFKLNNDKNALLKTGGGYERVTFHPDYSYSGFVGSYKPITKIDESTNKEYISYSYVPGPFVRVLVAALANAMTEHPHPFILVVEEINRANVAAVFGDVFQLLDRADNNVSEYEIHTSQELRKYLADALNVDEKQVANIRIPDNMFIWATMNSADQGVFPMDTAFKRRWDFDYLGINNEMAMINKYNFKLPNGKSINWNCLRKAINQKLASLKINEDKLLGPFFISEKVLKSGDDAFVDAFENKVLMYLFEDAAKQKKGEIFRDNQKSSGDVLLYSSLCENFQKVGISIFCDDIVSMVPYINYGSAEEANKA